MAGRMFTVKEVARYLRVSERTVYEMARTSRIPYTRVGRQYRFRRDQIDEWLSQQAKTPAQRRPVETVARRLDRVRRAPDTLTRRLLFIGELTAALEPMGVRPVIVGGNAVEFYTAGGYATGDIDIVAPSEPVDAVLRSWHFAKEGRHWYSDEFGIVIEAPASSLEPEQRERVAEVEIDDMRVYILAVEDVIIDRLSAYVHWKSQDDGFWAAELIRLHAKELDREYLARRAESEEVAGAFDDILKTLKEENE